MSELIKKTINDYINGQLNNQYGLIDKFKLATTTLKENVNVGEAVINIFGATGIAGFKFNVPEREIIKLQSEITDHYTDINNPVQDNIAQKPISITLTGLVGEYFYSVNEIEDLIATITPTLSLVKQFLPKLPNSTKQHLAKKYTNLTNKETPEVLRATDKKDLNSMNLFTLFQNIYKVSSRQTRAFLFFEALWKSKARFSVETSWKKYDNMVVESVTPDRDNNADITTFTVVVKQISFTQTLTDSVENVVGRMKEMLAPIENKGIDKGQKVETISGGGNA